MEESPFLDILNAIQDLLSLWSPSLLYSMRQPSLLVNFRQCAECLQHGLRSSFTNRLTSYVGEAIPARGAQFLRWVGPFLPVCENASRWRTDPAPVLFQLEDTEVQTDQHRPAGRHPHFQGKSCFFTFLLTDTDVALTEYPDPSVCWGFSVHGPVGRTEKAIHCHSL